MAKARRSADDPQAFDRFADDYDRFCGLQEVSDWPWMEAAGVRGAGVPSTWAVAPAGARSNSPITMTNHLRSLVAAGGYAVLVDCVAPHPTPPAWMCRVGAVLALPSDLGSTA